MHNYATEGLELLDVGVAIFDKDTRLVYANPAFRAMRRYPDDVCRTGVSFEALVRFNAERGDFGPGDPAVLAAERLTEILQSETRDVEREMADGQILAIKYRRTGSGGLVITFEDRTAERQAQAKLTLSEERHALVTRASSDGIYDWNVTNDVLYVSDTLIRVLDFDFDLRASGMWAERVHPEDLGRYVAAIRAHFRGETDALECEYRVRGASGDYRWILDRGIGVRGKDGMVTRMVGAVRDITEIREARAERNRSEARLMSSLATIADGTLLVDGENRVQLWNDRYYEIFTEAAGGADLSKVIVKDRRFFDMIRDGYNLGMFKPHPDGVDAWVTARAKAWQQPAAKWELELANGTWILLNERMMPDGGRVSVYTDISEFKRREGEAEAARQRFEDAIEAISSGFALFDATTPHLLIAAYLFCFGVLRSAQMIGMSALAYSDVSEQEMSKATSIFALGQRLSQSLGVGISATLLTLVAGGGPITVPDFKIVFVLIALLMACSAVGFRRLKPEDGWQVSGYRGDTA